VGDHVSQRPCCVRDVQIPCCVLGTLDARRKQIFRKNPKQQLLPQLSSCRKGYIVPATNFLLLELYVVSIGARTSGGSCRQTHIAPWVVAIVSTVDWRLNVRKGVQKVGNRVVVVVELSRTSNSRCTVVRKRADRARLDHH
jgi:hypothetical protein